MISDLLMQHPSEPFFSLSEKEYREAMQYYSRLSTDIVSSIYDDYSARTGINVGEQGYFDNGTILAQFESLFQLVGFKEFKGHEIEVVVDNARIHSAREYNISDFGKKIGTVSLMQSNTLTNKVTSTRSRLILIVVKIRENPRDYSN